MPIIAEHHRPGHWRHKLSDGTVFEPSCAWPEDCTVQWGGKGLVFAQAETYTTAFFEAFPKVPATFIRGEGATVALAEQDAFAKFERQRNCTGHDWERGRYRNGAALCKHCKLFGMSVFEPLDRCTVCNVPTSASVGYGPVGADGKKTEHWYCEEHTDARKANGHSNMLDKIEAEEALRDPEQERADEEAFFARLAQIEEELKAKIASEENPPAAES